MSIWLYIWWFIVKWGLGIIIIIIYWYVDIFKNNIRSYLQLKKSAFESDKSRLFLRKANCKIILENYFISLFYITYLDKYNP